jgi:signal transduction histidine kinase
MPEQMIAVDPDLLRRAVGNIIINALVHNSVDTKVKITIGNAASKILIAISDNGNGMDETELSDLWNRYYRGTNTKERPEGSGLGLAIAKQIITLHGGDISVESNPGLGTEFTILLPCRADTN